LRLLCLSLFVLLAAAADQPIPYSHKKHVALGLECTGCHTTPGKGEAATFPKEEQCMQCHAAVKKESPAIKTLTAYAKKKESVPWVRVYKLPEYVWFSHKIHSKAAKCADCHGDVGSKEVLVKEKPIDMNSCMACHDKHEASNECNICHNPA
jgi:c(7)-type cytochrome triheme protein